MSVEVTLKQVKDSLDAGKKDDAIKQLLVAVIAMNAREERRATYAHRLIAENMFAIVRLEIAQATEQIINSALAVKRDRTGSGNAEFALNVTGTLVMLAGNVLSGGSMNLLGSLLVAAGEMAQAAAKNDAAKLLTSLTHVASGVVGVSTREGSTEYLRQRREGFQFRQTSDVDNNQVETRSATDGISELVKTAGEGLFEVGGQFYERFHDEAKAAKTYSVVKKKTAWIRHGAGGTNAVTYDVQDAITAAYQEGLQKLCDELKAIGSTDDQVNNLGPNSILGSILSTQMDAKAKLHPMTAWVLKTAIKNLASSGGANYQALTGGSGVFGRESVLARAKRDVKEAYAFMQTSTDGYLVEVDSIREHIKTKFT